MNKLLKVKCPQCDTQFSYYESENRPFCSERCKMVDLGHWFEESYKVPDKEVAQPETKKNENTSNEKNTQKSNQEIENENGYDDYTQIDEDSYDENDY